MWFFFLNLNILPVIFTFLKLQILDIISSIEFNTTMQWS